MSAAPLKQRRDAGPSLGKVPANGRRARAQGALANELGIRIVSGQIAPGQRLNAEIDPSQRHCASRAAYRDAIRTLSDKGLVVPRPRTGTIVSKPRDWHLLDPDVLGWVFQGAPDHDLLQDLFQLRYMVEPEAAALAAARRKQRHLDAMRDALSRMSVHTLRDPAGLKADADFHAALLAATDNPFIVSLTLGVTTAVAALTEYKQRAAPLRRDPIPDHESVYEAIAARDVTKARDAMGELIRLAVIDTSL